MIRRLGIRLTGRGAVVGLCVAGVVAGLVGCGQTVPGRVGPARSARPAGLVAPLPVVPAGGSAGHVAGLVGRSAAVRPEPGLSPYVDMLTYPPIDLAATLRAGGNNTFKLGFIRSRHSTCAASWGDGVASIHDPSIGARIGALQAAGGHAVVSFGGAGGADLALPCADARSLAAQYQAVISTYRLRAIDVNIEGPSLDVTAALARRSAALAAVQRAAARAGHPLTITLTLPGTLGGLLPNAMAAVRSAVANGVRLSGINVMAANYGSWPAPSPAGHMGAYAIQVVERTADELAAVFPGLSRPARLHLIALTVMNGMDDLREPFGLADAHAVRAYATRVGLAGLSMWSLGRDRACSAPSHNTNSSCSGIAQAPREFSRILSGF